MEAKRLFAETLIARGLRAETEWVVPTRPSYRRADVMVWTKSGKRVAIELQHTPIGLEEIEARAVAYANADIVQIWIPFLPSSVWEEAEACDRSDRRSEYFVSRYFARPFEKWVHGFNYGHLIYFDPASKQLWAAHFEKHKIVSEGSTWYDECGEEQSSSGYSRWSKRWRELTLVGPYDLKEVRFKPKPRKASSLGPYRWPSGSFIELLAPH